MREGVEQATERERERVYEGKTRLKTQDGFLNGLLEHRRERATDRERRVERQTERERKEKNRRIEVKARGSRSPLMGIWTTDEGVQTKAAQRIGG